MAVQGAAGPVLPFDLCVGTDSDQTQNIGIVTFLGTTSGLFLRKVFGPVLRMNQNPAIATRLGTTFASVL